MKTVMEFTEENKETAIVLEEEIEFGIIESRSKIDKRKNDESEQRPKKRKKFENIVNIVNWGDDDDTNDVETNGLVDWLVRGESNANASKELKDETFRQGRMS